MNVRIRPATDADLPAVGALHQRSRTAAYAGLVGAAALRAGSAAAMTEWWTERLRWECDTHRLMVAGSAADGSVAGFSYVGPSSTAGAVELYAIHVGPELVGTGVGRALMLEALEALDDLAGPGVDRAVLWVLAGNTRARAFYAAGGWVPDGARRDAPIGPDLVAQVRYTYPLPYRGDLAGGSA